MKFFNFSLIITLLAGLAGYSQTTNQQIPRVTLYPRVEQLGDPDILMQKVEITNDYTIISFIHTNKSKADSSWIEINPAVQLIAVGGKRRLNFVKSEGLPIAPEQYFYKTFGEKKYFKLYFDKAEPGIELFDMFECISNDQIICFNFYGVHIQNPEIPVVVTPPPTNDKTKSTKPIIPVITVTGKVLDEKTKKPIVAKVIFETMPGLKPISTVQSTAIGVYKTTISPPSLYGYSASAKGYLVSEENIDLSTAVDKQVIVKNILLKPIQLNETIRLNNIFFAQGEYALLSSSFGELDKLAKLMKANPTMEIMLEGHTDIIGNPDDNMTLSENRVKSVKQYLVNKGIIESRIQTKAYGGTKPIKTEGTDDERQVNRRVEFKIIKK